MTAPAGFIVLRSDGKPVEDGNGSVFVFAEREQAERVASYWGSADEPGAAAPLLRWRKPRKAQHEYGTGHG